MDEPPEGQRSTKRLPNRQDSGRVVRPKGRGSTTRRDRQGAAPQTPDWLLEDSISFEKFYAEMHSRVQAFLKRLGAREHEARDCTQEAFVKLLLKWPLVGKGKIKNPKAYVFTVARNDFLGQRTRLREVSMDPGDLELMDAPASPPPDELTPVESETLAAMKYLTPSQREVLALQVDGFNTAEIAHLMHITPEAVRSHRSQGLSRLKKALEATITSATNRSTRG